MVEMVPVTSTNISAVGYDALLSELHVAFHGGDTYVFEEFPAALHQTLMAEKSKGSFFHKNIRGKFKHRPPEKEKPPA